MEFTNLCPHDIVIYDKDEKTILETIPSIGYARVIEEQGSPLISFGSIQIVSPPKYMGLDFHPTKLTKKNVIVSAIFAKEAVKVQYHHLIKFFSPDTGPNGVVRNEKGEIIGTKQLIYWGE